MKILAAGLASIALIIGTGAASALIVLDARIQEGRLIVRGTTTGAKQKVTLDDQFTVTSSAAKNFSFNLVNYHPTDCIVQVEAGGDTTTGVVAFCGPRGLTPRGAWQEGQDYLTDDLVTHEGSSWRAKLDNKNKQPGPGLIWEQFAAKGDRGPRGLRGPAGPPGATAPTGLQGPQGLAQGPQGRAGFGAVTVQFTQSGADLAAGAEVSVDAFCPTGQQGIGGGVRGDVTNSELTKVTVSRPIISAANTGAPVDNAAFTGWRGTFVNINNGAGIRPEVWVICVVAP